MIADSQHFTVNVIFFLSNGLQYRAKIKAFLCLAISQQEVIHIITTCQCVQCSFSTCLANIVMIVIDIGVYLSIFYLLT